MSFRFALAVALSLATASFAQASHLNWCRLDQPEARSVEPLKSRLNRSLEIAQSSLAFSFPVVSKLTLEHALPGTAGRAESEAAVRDLPRLVHLAICSRFASPRSVGDQCRSKLIFVIEAWYTTYKPTGNPINENRLLPLIEAIDLIYDQLGTVDRIRATALLAGFITEGDRFFASMKSSDSRSKNNWATWRMALRSVAAQTISSTDRLIGMVTEQAKANLSNPDGSSVDFHERDALLYHVYDLEAFETIATLVPGALDTDTRGRIAKALIFLKPYVTGEKTHIEFVHSSVKFDRERKSAGLPDYQNVAWNKKNASKMLSLASVTDSAVRAWAPLAEESDDPLVRLYAAACLPASAPAAALTPAPAPAPAH